MRRLWLFSLVVLPGVAAVGMCGYYLLQDWAALNAAFARLERLSAGSGDLRSIVAADTLQNAFRLNCFADGVGVLLGAILAAIGIQGLCLLPRGVNSSGREKCLHAECGGSMGKYGEVWE